MRSSVLCGMLLLLVVSSWNSQVHAQSSDHVVDSLLAIWNDPDQTDETRMKSMDLLFDPQTVFFIYDFSRFEDIKQYADQLIELAKKNKHAYYQVKAMTVKAFILSWEQDDPEKIWRIVEEAEQVAIDADDSLAYLIVLESKASYYSDVEDDAGKSYKYMIEAVGLAERLGEKDLEARMNHGLAWMIGNTDNHDRSVPYFKKALKYYLESGKMKDAGSVALNLGRAFYFMKEYDSAKVYLFQAMENYKQSTDSIRGILWVMSRLQFVYEKEEDYEKMAATCLRGLELAKAHVPTGVWDWHFNVAKSYDYLGNRELAYAHLDSAIQGNETNLNKINRIFNMNRHGNLYLKMGDGERAKERCEEAYEAAVNANSFWHIRDACECLHGTYRLLGDAQKALEFQDLAKAYEDSMSRDETAQEIQRLEFEQMIIENEKRSKMMEESYAAEVRKKRQDRNIAWGIGILASLTSLGFFFRWRYVRRSRDTISKERERSENLLHNILPAEVAEELKAKGQSEARDFDMVSILFTDFVRFTETSEKLSATELVAEINTCFQAFDRILEKHKIEKIKTIGDAYMAAGGLPVSTQETVKNTVLAALDMQAFITARKSKLDAEGGTGFNMRVGVHTGPVVAGIVGLKKLQYDIWGDTVNTAHRMESHGEAGRVNISSNTYELLKDDADLNFEARGRIEVKGKGEMEMYFVTKK